MIRVNIISGNKQITENFYNIKQVFDYLVFDLKIKANDECAVLGKKIWDLNVGSATKYDSYTFACAGKTRVGNHLTF